MRTEKGFALAGLTAAALSGEGCGQLSEYDRSLLTNTAKIMHSELYMTRNFNSIAHSLEEAISNIENDTSSSDKNLDDIFQSIEAAIKEIPELGPAFGLSSLRQRIQELKEKQSTMKKNEILDALKKIDAEIKRRALLALTRQVETQASLIKQLVEIKLN